LALRGRDDECASLNGLLDAVRRGESRSLVLRGEAGIGKTALLEYLIASAAPLTVVRAVGVESEMELVYAGLHQLCAPLLDRLHEWLRRQQRRVDARAQLRAAHDQFTSIGMDAFAERTRKELLATGERLRTQTVETRDDLTGQERQIARLAREGLSNPEIGARLFLSSRTVEWHLRKVFTKLGISSRRELASVLSNSESEPVPV
jgi:DNA-binding CsgD family transcriptional regulator